MLVIPVAFAMMFNAAEYRVPAISISLVLVLWIALRARTIFQAAEVNVGHVVSGLAAGIVFVDWLAVAPLCPREFGIVFVVLWGAALLLQRLVPAV
jgi:hypothetical protein